MQRRKLLHDIWLKVHTCADLHSVAHVYIKDDICLIFRLAEKQDVWFGGMAAIMDPP